MNSLYKTLLALVCCLVAWSGAAEIPWHEPGDLAGALEAMESPDNRLVIVFSATWCGPCRKMAATTLLDPKLDELGEDVSWLKVDVDQHRKVAARFGVRGVPKVVVLDQKGVVHGDRVGFMDTDTLVGLVTGDPVAGTGAMKMDTVRPGWWEGKDPAEMNPADVPSRVEEAVQYLADPEGGNRRLILRGLARVGEPTHAPLASLLGHEELRIRAAAAEALAHVSRRPETYDPFAEKARRDAQAAAWAGALGVALADGP